MINILINEKFEGMVDPVILEKTVLKVLECHPLNDEVDISIAIEDDAQLQNLNHQFLGIEAPTDVLAFPGEEMDPDTGHLYLGDIVISLPTASVQASIAGHPLQNEISLLVVHGILHLLGYDHATPELKSKMWQVQSKILNELSIQIHKLPEE